MTTTTAFTPATGYINEAIGTVTFTEATEPRTEHHTSYAADYRTFTVLPGTYDARLVRRSATSGADVYVTVDIEVTHEAIHSGFGGVNFATDRNTEVRRDTKTYRVYDYEAARAAADFRPTLAGGAFHLADDWAVLTVHKTFEDGRHYTSNKFGKTA